MFERARSRLERGLVHRQALFGFASWPLHYWRLDALDERDFEWFEAKYPGWYDEYGAFFEAHRACQDPGEAALLLNGLLEGAPPTCWTCMLPCVLEEDMTHRVVAEHTRFYCSRECQWLDESNPGRYGGDRHFFDRYHGWDLADAVSDMGFVRSDGKTTMAQPHLHDEGRWTLADLRRAAVELKSPNILTAQRMGLPDGSALNGLTGKGDRAVALGLGGSAPAGIVT
jgi:propane monooxygenase large subunit